MGIWIDDLLRLVLKTVLYVLVEHSLRRKGVQTRIADECCTLIIGSVINEYGHIFLSKRNAVWGDVGVFEKQEAHVAFSFAIGAAIFHREPFATLFEGQHVDGYGEVEFFKKGICFV